MALAITKDNFEEISASQLPVVIDFWAEWCGPCRMISPIIDELAGEYEGRAVIGKCDVDNNDDIVGKFMVRNIPTIVFIKGGQVVDKQVGACTKADLVKKLEKLLETRTAAGRIPRRLFFVRKRMTECHIGGGGTPFVESMRENGSLRQRQPKSAVSKKR